jgi:acyl-CoA thioester hydrolase
MLATGCAMAVRDVRMQYLKATFAGDQLWVGDWLTHNDGRLRATRQFQILREADKACVMRAEIDYICIDVASGRPRRMPEVFIEAYRVENN